MSLELLEEGKRKVVYAHAKIEIGILHYIMYYSPL
jgi:hypothetical protein